MSFRLRFQVHLNAVSSGFMTFSGRGFPQILMRFAVLDKNSSFWSNFRKTFLPRVKETTDKNARSMARKAHPRQTAPLSQKEVYK